ncbi:MAG TPA: hypothetical protein GXX69_10410 [Firmicutes bacterium]|jgi:uncharacterized membrane protein YwzB|nr:hypothetical protein [Bacillota bacterium]
MDIIRLVIHVIFLSFFYWFILSVVRVMERDMAVRKEEAEQIPYWASRRGGD